MAALSQIPEFEVLEGNQTPMRTESTVFRGFLIWLLLVCATLYFSVIPLIRIPSYERWGTSHWGPMLNFAFEPGPQNADVIIFGDSSAFLGIDPRLIDEQLGIRSLVMPNTVGSLPITGDVALQQYLNTHVSPRLIVFYFSPWNLDFNHTQNARLYEGEEMLLRHGTWRAVTTFAMQRPEEFLLFPFRHYSTLGPTVLKNLIHHRDREREIEQALGHADDREDYPPLSAPCAVPSSRFSLSSDGSIRHLVEKYTTPRVRVIVYLAPVPQCANIESLLRTLPSDLRDAPTAILPAQSFLGDGYFAHIEPGSVPVATRLLAQAIKANLGPVGR